MPRKPANKKTEYEKARDRYRALSPRHVVTFEADMDEDAKRHTFSIADDIRQAGNDLTAELNKRYRQLIRTKAYRALKKDYGWHVEHMKNLDPEGKLYQQLDAERKALAGKMDVMQREYKVTWADARKLMEDIYPSYRINSIFALKKAESVWQGMEKILYGNGRRLHFKKRGDLPAIQAKQSNRGIPISLNDKGELSFYLEGVGDFGILPPEKDRFLKEEMERITDYLKDPSVEDYLICRYMQTKEVEPAARPCYASLVCKTIRGRLRVYVQVTVASFSTEKKKKDGSPRHQKGKGRVGVDLGTQSCAASSRTATELFNLAERNGKCTKEYEERKKFLLQKMDGTYTQGSRGKVKKSNHYKRYEKELHELERRNADSRKYAIREDANRIRSYGDICIIEPPNASRLQKRAKKTIRQEKATAVTDKNGKTRMIHKYKRKKRFGRSIHHRCPGLMQAELKKKFGDGYYEVPPGYRASQYDHEKDTYQKKGLNERWHVLEKGGRIQRDSYSSFLLECADKDYKTIDRERCLQRFPEYRKAHREMVEDILAKGLIICNSGIRPGMTF